MISIIFLIGLPRAAFTSSEYLLVLRSLANYVKTFMIKIKEYILLFLKTIIASVDKHKQLNELSDNLFHTKFATVSYKNC